MGNYSGNNIGNGYQNVLIGHESGRFSGPQSIPNKVKVINRIQGYNTFNQCKNTSGYIVTSSANGLTLTNAADNNILVLGQYSNYFKKSLF